MTADDIDNLLNQMRDADPTFRVSLAKYHKYRTGPPLSEGELQAFEQQHSVTLPADFRFFLKEVGHGSPVRSSARFIGVNSGAGPGCGVNTLEEAVISCDLGTPFPLTESVEVKPFPGIDRWGDEENFPGVLEICYHGGAEFSYLVVNGFAYGTVWNAWVEPHIMNFHCSHLSFESWYGDWMERLKNHALPRLANEHRIAEAQVGMTKAEIIALCGEEWEQKSRLFRKNGLAFKQLSTEFEMDEEDVVTRIIAYDILL